MFSELQAGQSNIFVGKNNRILTERKYRKIFLKQKQNKYITAIVMPKCKVLTNLIS